MNPTDGTPLIVHHEDHIHEMLWPPGLAVPRWGEAFRFKGGSYSIDHAGWTIEEVEIEGVPEGAVAAALQYHIYLEDFDDDDTGRLEPGVLPPLRRV